MTDALPEYEKSLRMVERARLAEGFVRQVELTAGPFLARPLAQSRVIDIGCGYGHGVVELARRCASVVGVEPNPVLAGEARRNAADLGLDNVEIREGTISGVDDVEEFDLVVLDNVLEHIEDQPEAVRVISRCLRPSGVAFVLVPNRAWPIEVHYGLPFLSWLPLPVATAYLRASGRGRDYRDASYAPTLGRLRSLFAPHPELRAMLALPGDVSLAEGGGSPVYRVGVAALRRFPRLWAVSKAFLLVVRKAAN